MLNVRLADGHQYVKSLFTWLSLVIQLFDLFRRTHLKYFDFISGVQQTFGEIYTYLMKPHTVMGSFLYEWY